MTTDGTLNQLEALVAENDKRARIESRNRMRLLWIACLSVLFVSVGLSLSYDTLVTSNSFEPGVRFVLWWPWSVVALSAVSAVSLGVGLITGNLRAQWFGLAGMCLFYGIIAAVFSGNIVNRITGHYAPGAPPAVYAVPVYLHLSFAMWTQLRTTSKLMRAGVPA